MTSFKVIEGFYDLQDPEGKSFHFYNKGDAYPRRGIEPTDERIKELSGKDNKRKQPLIEEAPEGITEETVQKETEEVTIGKRRPRKAK